MRFSYRVHENGGNKLLAIADADVVGKTLLRGGVPFKVVESFYAGAICAERKVTSLAGKATIINAVGKNVVTIMIKAGIVDGSMVLDIGGVPHAQVVRL